MTHAAGMRSDVHDGVISESHLPILAFKKILELNKHVEPLAQAIFKLLPDIGLHGGSDGSLTESSERATIKAILEIVDDSVLARVRDLMNTSKEEDKLRKHGDTEADAGEIGGHVVNRNEEVPIIDEGHVETDDRLYLKATQRGTKRGAPAKPSSVRKKSPTHKAAHDGKSTSADSGEAVAAQEEGSAFFRKPIEGGHAIEQQHGVPNSNLLLQPRRGGNDEDATGRAVEKKKRNKRADNWSEEETGFLLQVWVSPEKSVGRSGRSKTKWDLISKQMQKLGRERTGDQCRERMDTLKKWCSRITKQCENNKLEFSQLGEEDFQILRKEWYILLRDNWKRTLKANTGKLGAGSPPGLTQNSDVISGASTSDLTGATLMAGSPKAGSLSPDALATKVVTTFNGADQSELTLTAGQSVGTPQPKCIPPVIAEASRAVVARPRSLRRRMHKH